jgi:cytochrome c553
MSWGKNMNRIAIFVCVVSIVVASFVVFTAGDGMAGSEKEVTKKKPIPYVGITACKKCHIKEYMSWKKTRMAKTFEVLKPGEAVETKTKFNLDPKKDYTKDAGCLSCHTTGYGKPGGYPKVISKDAKVKKQAKENQGTTCEGCHGAGSKYIELHKQIATKKRKYTLKEMYDAGMYKMDAKACTSCHNPKNPTAPEGYKFDYARDKSKDTHKVFPLKYRTE